MSDSRSKGFLFDGAFACNECGSVIEVKIALAIIKSTGAEVTCRHCQSRFLITEEGAVPTKGFISGTVTYGELAWEEEK